MIIIDGSFVVDVHVGIIRISRMYSKDNTCVKTSSRCITQLAKIIIGPKCIEHTADVFTIVQ